MLQTEYIRNLQCNYERILLEQKPEEKRYQYCILNRGGIKGLLPCSLRYINSQAYLYYDITSRQKVSQLFDNKQVTREWMLEFVWNFQRLQQELSRFLLDISNVIWYPEQIFQDLESKTFSFLYVPYFEEYNGFMNLVDFWLEHLDYEDEALVEFVYQVHRQLESHGEQYLQEQMIVDAEKLERKDCLQTEQFCEEKAITEEMLAVSEDEAEEIGAITETKAAREKDGIGEMIGAEQRRTEQEVEKEPERGTAEEGTAKRTTAPIIIEKKQAETGKEKQMQRITMPAGTSYEYHKNKKELTEEKRGILGIFEGRKQENKRKKNKEERENYRSNMQAAMSGYAVADGVVYDYEEEYGRTIYLEENPNGPKQPHLLYSANGKLLAGIEKDTLTIGKKKEEADLILDDASVSRMHARLLKEGEEVYLQDLNSTNGTYKNGLRLEPYEKRKLEKEDEIKCGNVTLIFR